MSNPNLRADNPHLVKFTKETAAEMGRRGGLKDSPKRAWAMRKYCDDKCLYYDRCPAISTSMTDMFEVKDTCKSKSKKIYRCAIKTYQQEIQNYFYNLFSDGEHGLIKVIMELHFRLLIEVGKKPSAKMLKEAIEVTLAVKKSVYGDKSKVELSGGVAIFQAPDLRKVIMEIDAKELNPDPSEA